jgi:hypothetical protein
VSSTQFAGVDESSAGSGSWKAPSRDLYGTSDPAMLAGGDWSSLEWDTYPPAGMDKKPSWGFGGEAPEGCALCARGVSSLDSLGNNRHKPENVPAYYRRPIGRGKFCGRKCVCGVDPKTGRTLYKRINCGSWTCSYCGPRRARTARAAIRGVAERLQLRYFLTLTLDPKKLEHPKFAVPHLRLCFNKFREYLRRKYGESPRYVCVLEFTKAGVPHLHILFDRYIDQHWISDVWDSLGGGRIVFIKRVTIQKISCYLSKYLTKELLLSAPKGTRRITAARSIKLFPKFDSGVSWELLSSSIWQELRDRRMHNFQLQANLYEVIDLDFDEEDYLRGFTLINHWSDKGETGT